MKRIRPAVLIIFMITSLSLCANAQEKSVTSAKPYNNSINAYFGIFEFNLNYERTISRHPGSSTALRMGFGSGEFVTAGDGLYINPSVVQLIGKKNSHLEIDLGLKYIVNYSGGNSDLSLVLVPDIFAGYRYEKPDGRLIFRFGMNYPTLINMGIGFRF
jgi:hypothetical protein